MLSLKHYHTNIRLLVLTNNHQMGKCANVNQSPNV
jgi:hypothetical protein